MRFALHWVQCMRKTTASFLLLVLLVKFPQLPYISSKFECLQIDGQTDRLLGAVGFLKDCDYGEACQFSLNFGTLSFPFTSSQCATACLSLPTHTFHSAYMCVFGEGLPYSVFYLHSNMSGHGEDCVCACVCVFCCL